MNTYSGICLNGTVKLYCDILKKLTDNIKIAQIVNCVYLRIQTAVSTLPEGLSGSHWSSRVRGNA